MNSILLLEAALMGRPTLSILPRAVEAKSLATIQAGLTACVTTREQLRAALPGFLAGRPGPSPAQIREFARPGSLERTVDFLESVLGSRRPAGEGA
jgi:hypothetical protein